MIAAVVTSCLCHFCDLPVHPCRHVHRTQHSIEHRFHSHSRSSCCHSGSCHWVVVLHTLYPRFCFHMINRLLTLFLSSFCLHISQLSFLFLSSICCHCCHCGRFLHHFHFQPIYLQAIISLEQTWSYFNLYSGYNLVFRGTSSCCLLKTRALDRRYCSSSLNKFLVCSAKARGSFFSNTRQILKCNTNGIFFRHSGSLGKMNS